MFEGFTLAELALAIGTAFVLGSIPTAYVVSRLRGVNIFEVGTRQAGATNVYREVGAKYGGIVLTVDASKGALAIVLASRWAGLQGEWLLLPAFSAILGHWNSPMTRFRGGDGVATGVGVVIALAPLAMLTPIAVGAAVLLARVPYSSHPSLWGGLAGYFTFLGLSLFNQMGLSALMVLGISTILAMIVLHSMTYHRRRRGKQLVVEDTPLDAESPMPRTIKP